MPTTTFPTPVQIMLKIILFCLLVDLISFTSILPLFPRIFKHYNDTDPLMQQLITTINNYGWNNNNSKLDFVVVGGIVGSGFSVLQFLVSPIIGKLSDLHGRRKVLLATMLGNILSQLLWVNATSFKVFLLSRFVGGLTEGNVQLTIAMISDISSKQEKTRNLALVGICFAVAFTIGPPFGAYLTTIGSNKDEFHTTAIFSFCLILLETLVLVLYLPETINTRKQQEQEKLVKVVEVVPTNKQWKLNLVHFMFLFCFSGMEYTLTFLTFDQFQYTNVQQGLFH